MIILAAILTILTIVLNIIEYSSMPDAGGGPLVVIAVLVVPLITMTFLLFSMFARSVGNDEKIVAEMRKGFSAILNKLEEMDGKSDQRHGTGGEGPGPNADTKKVGGQTNG